LEIGKGFKSSGLVAAHAACYTRLELPREEFGDNGDIAAKNAFLPPFGCYQGVGAGVAVANLGVFLGLYTVQVLRKTLQEGSEQLLSVLLLPSFELGVE